MVFSAFSLIILAFPEHELWYLSLSSDKCWGFKCANSIVADVGFPHNLLFFSLQISVNDHRTWCMDITSTMGLYSLLIANCEFARPASQGNSDKVLPYAQHTEPLPRSTILSSNTLLQLVPNMSNGKLSPHLERTNSTKVLSNDVPQTCFWISFQINFQVFFKLF